MNKKTLTRILIIFIILQFPVLIFLANARYTVFNLKFYANEFNRYHPDTESPLETANDLLYFLEYKETDITYINKFSEQEVQHLIDVKGLMQRFLLLLKISFLILITGIIALFYLNKEKILKNFSLTAIYGGLLTSFILLILYISTKSFSPAFTKFHNIFFTGNWQFPNDFLLIKLFPAEFFMNILTKIMQNVFTSANILILVGVVLFIVNRRKK